MKIIFMGTPNFAAGILEGLIKYENIDIAAVFTGEDAVRGRGKKLVETDVAICAKKNGIDVFKPKSLKNTEVLDQIKAFEADFICVAAYGKLLPIEVLNAPKYNCLNVHGSLLPKWRGAAPIQRAILAGDKYCGTSIMNMEIGMDTGDYCLCSSVEVADKTFYEIEQELISKSVVDMVNAMESIMAGSVKWTVQEEEKVTYAKKIEKRELWLSPEDDLNFAKLKIQASNEAHPSKCSINCRNVTIIKAVKSDDFDISLDCGKVLFVNKRLFLGFSNGLLEILEIKPDGKNIMDAKSFSAGVQNIKSGNVVWGEIK